MLSTYRNRVKRFFEKTPENVDTVIITSGDGILRYFTGSREGTAVLRRSGEIELAVTDMTAENAYLTGFPVSHVITADLRSDPGAWKAMLARLVSRGRALGIQGDKTGWKGAEQWRELSGGMEIEDISPAIIEAGSVKDEAELANLRSACAISRRVADEVPGMLETGMTERDLGKLIDMRMHDLGAESTTFPTIAAFGPGSSFPHAIPGWRKLAPGHIVQVDFGAVIEGSGGDITRTFAFGHADDQLENVYKTVALAQDHAFELIREGKTGKEIDDAVTGLFAKFHFGPFIHSIGHTLGLVRGPFTSIPGAVVTVEPGIYQPGWGGVRIEDDILIREDGDIEFLTGRAPADIPVLGTGRAV